MLDGGVALLDVSTELVWITNHTDYFGSYNTLFVELQMYKLLFYSVLKMHPQIFLQKKTKQKKKKKKKKKVFTHSKSSWHRQMYSKYAPTARSFSHL